MEIDLKKLQLLQFELVLEVKRICEKEKIPYFIIAGTLLGAVRHKGYIPWDDDLDVGMLREDYERFLSVCQNELDSRFFLQTWESDPGYGHPFAKLRLNGTRYVEQNAAKVKVHDGIFIDLFPFDCVPDQEIKQKRQNRSTYLLKRLLLARNGYQVWDEGQSVKRFIYLLLRAAAHLVPRKALQNRLNREMTRYNGQHTKKIVTFGGSYGYWKESVQRVWMERQVQLPFESAFLSAPAGFQEYLSYFYGDYMTPPPEDQRADRHKIKRISFGAY